jgi:NitT/TauT family transport system substrate-binding protein
MGLFAGHRDAARRRGALLPLLVLLLGCGGAAHAADTVRVGKAIAVAFTFIQPDIGKAAGVWQKYGLDPEVIAFAGDAKMQQAFAAGSIDFAMGSGPSMAFAVKGSPVRAVAAYMGSPVHMGLVVGYNAPIKSAADLKGKKLAVTTVGSLTDWPGQQLSIAQGWGPGGITTVALGTQQAIYAALRTGQVDGVITNTDIHREFEERKEGRDILNAGSFVPHFITEVIFARTDLIEKQPDLVQRFVNGFFASVAFMKQNRAQTIDIAAKAMGIDKDVTASAYDIDMPAMIDDGRFDPSALAAVKSSFLEMKLLDSEPEDDALLTRRFVPARP